MNYEQNIRNLVVKLKNQIVNFKLEFSYYMQTLSISICNFIVDNKL